MPEKRFADVSVKVVAITRGNAILTVFNPRWGGYSLPMSKTKTWPHPDDSSKIVEESPRDTAIRAAVEALGRPLGLHELPKHHPVHSLEPYDQSARDAEWKCYHYEVFQLEVGPGEIPKPFDGAPLAWMTMEEFETLQPVTSTARYIATAMKAASSLPSKR
jgi:hypothetical protein